ncbi:hypothetical protein C4Q27_06000 [Pseudomonas sp. SWI36]|nr:hypothetical protein C4Q27_06000 [Pseudomonas sp. SWI36]
MGRLVGAPFFAWGICRGCAGPFAGKPAPTPDRWWTHIGDWAQAVVGAGLPAKGPVQANKKSPHQTMRAFSSLIPGFRPPWLPAGSASGSVH